MISPIFYDLLDDLDKRRECLDEEIVDCILSMNVPIVEAILNELHWYCSLLEYMHHRKTHINYFFGEVYIQKIDNYLDKYHNYEFFAVYNDYQNQRDIILQNILNGVSEIDHQNISESEKSETIDSFLEDEFPMPVLYLKFHKQTDKKVLKKLVSQLYTDNENIDVLNGKHTELSMSGKVRLEDILGIEYPVLTVQIKDPDALNFKL